MKTTPNNPSMKCQICGRKFVDQAKFGKHLDRHIEEAIRTKKKRGRKLDAVERWVRDEYKHYMKAPEDTDRRLFTSELGCRAVFIAVNDIMGMALRNDDDEVAHSCCQVIDALARCRLLWIEDPE